MRLNSRIQRVLVGDEAEFYVFDIGFASPVIRKGMKFDILAAVPFYEFIRACAAADRSIGEAVARILDRFLRDDTKVMRSEALQRRAVRIIQGDLEGIVVNDFRFLDDAENGARIAAFCSAVIGELDVISRQGLSVMEFDALAKMENIFRSVILDVPAFRKERLDLQIVRDPDQRFINIGADRKARAVTREIRVKGSRFLRVADDNIGTFVSAAFFCRCFSLFL